MTAAVIKAFDVQTEIVILITSNLKQIIVIRKGVQNRSGFKRLYPTMKHKRNRVKKKQLTCVSATMLSLQTEAILQAL